MNAYSDLRFSISSLRTSCCWVCMTASASGNLGAYASTGYLIGLKRGVARASGFTNKLPMTAEQGQSPNYCGRRHRERRWLRDEGAAGKRQVAIADARRRITL